jgi:hypothetical protein
LTKRLPIPVEIAPEAAAFVREKGGALLLRSTLRHGCCGGRVELAKAEVGRPPEDAAFDRFEIDGLLLFAEQGLLADLAQPVRIGLDRILSFRALYLEGVPAKM